MYFLLFWFLSVFLQWCNPLPLSSSVHCAVRKQISPCTCRYNELSSYPRKSIAVKCERMANFSQVVEALSGKFEKDVEIDLQISHSVLNDLPQMKFEELGLTINHLKLNHVNISCLPDTVFTGLKYIEILSLSNNQLKEIPRDILRLMPLIRTLDLGNSKIENVTSLDLQDLTLLKTLILNNNNITNLDKWSLPSTITKLSLTQNKIKSLNGTLRKMTELEWLFVNGNNLESLDGELPEVIPNKALMLLNAADNRLKRPPFELAHCKALDVLFLENNEILSLEGSLKATKYVRLIDLSRNNISWVAKDEFYELSLLEDLYLGHNNIRNLNSSLLPLRSLRHLNLTRNKLETFSFHELRGLKKLTIIDLSYNGIKTLSGRMENMVELETRINEIRLEYNALERLSKPFQGLTGLHRLNVSHNMLEFIRPDDLIGLEELQILDISHNRLMSLEDVSMVVLPALEELIASYNSFKNIQKDFYGMPRLCWADFGFNKIQNISIHLADNTNCQLHGVSSTFRLYLQGNSVVCNQKFVPVIVKIESRNNTKIYGSSDCSNIIENS